MAETTASKPQVTYKTLRRNMLHGNRDVTDKYWSILFFAILAIWIGSFGYAMHQATDSRPAAHNQTTFESRLNGSLADNWFTEILSATAKSIDKYSKESWSTIMFIKMLISMLTMMSLMILIRFAPKFCAHLAIAGTTLTIISLISAIGMHLVKDEWTRVKPFHEKLILYIVPELIAFVLCVSALVAMMYIKAFAMSEILRKSSRIFFFYRYSIFFGLFIFGVTMFVLNSTIKVVQGLGWNNILFYTIMGGSIYIMHFIYYFGRMVIAMLAATHHWTPNKNSIHFTALFSAIVSVSNGWPKLQMNKARKKLRRLHILTDITDGKPRLNVPDILWFWAHIWHHFGTVCFNATVILPPIVALTALCKLKFEPVQTFANRFIKFVFSVYLTFYIAEYSTIVTAIHDLNFYQSTKKTCQVLIKDCPRSLAFLRVFGTIANIVTVILFLSDTVISALYWQRNLPDLVTSSITMLFTYAFMSLPVYLLMDTITDTTVICVMDEDEDNIISEEKPLPIMFNGSAA